MSKNAGWPLEESSTLAAPDLFGEPIPYEPTIEAAIDDAARKLDLAHSVGGSQPQRLERSRAILRALIATIVYLSK